MKKALVLFFLICSVMPAQIPSIQKLAESYDQSDSLKHAQWGVYAKYVDNGEVVVSLNSEESLAPASCMKTLTVAAGYCYLGSDFRCATKIYYDGEIDGKGTLTGNIYIVGGGDPTLGSSLVKGSLPLDSLMGTWKEALRAKGIKKINGAVIADDSFFDPTPIPDTWVWGDMGNYYGMSVSGLCMNDNLYQLYFKPAAAPGGPAEILRMNPEIPGLTFTNYMKTGEKGSGDNGYIYCAPNQYTAEAKGTIPAGVDEFFIKGSIPNPALFAAQYFTAYLNKSGIAVANSAMRSSQKTIYNEFNLIHTTYSPEYKYIAEIILKRSFNLYAEQVFKLISVKNSGDGSFEHAADMVMKYLKDYGIDSAGVKLYDGSGLSRANMITAKTFVDLFAHVAKTDYFEDYYHTFSLAGDSTDIGFFKRFGVGTEVAYNARIKSGTIGRVKCHSGYIKDKSGRLIAFSFLANNLSISGDSVLDIHKELLKAIARLE
jgi:D-alanyl-D-alanine carboxypeptidase/D-alanyl-D-alanine-endopeptidase (penicillin-binding protein 4)